MPTYEYQCEKCNATFEVFQSMKDERLTVCPRERCAQAEWGQGKVKRLLGTGAGIIFKGTGFYSTDYRSSNYTQAAKNDKSTSTATPAQASGSESSAAKVSQSSTGSAASAAPPAKSSQ